MTGDNETVKIFNVLRDVGCCKRCSLRLSNASSVDYGDPDKAIKNLESTPETVGGLGEPPEKKAKASPCVVCLDLLEDQLLNDMVAFEQLSLVSEYDSKSFVNYVNIPPSVMLRERSIQIYIRDKFPTLPKDHHFVPQNRAWSLSLQDKLAKVLNKKNDKSSNLNVQFLTTSPAEKEESSAVNFLAEEFSRRPRDRTISKNEVIHALEGVDDERFRRYCLVPPSVPSSPLIFDGIIVQHEPIYIAGRYCKFSRELGQSPWIVEDVRVVNNSVQEIIFESLKKVFSAQGLIFSASGREDFDVRMLGRGRPFYIKIINPKTTRVSFEEFRAIEADILSSGLVLVQDLQFVKKSTLHKIKEGEETKTKVYRALCITNEPENLQTYIDKINKLQKLTIQQKTPIRVSHRRSSAVRTKEICSIKACSFEGKSNIFQVDLVTQAGTYVKEFIHGDFGRTKPSLGTIIGGSCDILALDVLDINLDFPPKLNHNG